MILRSSDGHLERMSIGETCADYFVIGGYKAKTVALCSCILSGSAEGCES